jgi:hypothetical protein
MSEIVNIVFESMWQGHQPFTVSYVNSSQKIQDIFVYLKPTDPKNKESLNKAFADLEKNKVYINELMQNMLHLEVK